MHPKLHQDIGIRFQSILVIVLIISILEEHAEWGCHTRDASQKRSPFSLQSTSKHQYCFLFVASWDTFSEHTLWRRTTNDILSWVQS
eukprot:1468496-Amphidinium_carterae.1